MSNRASSDEIAAPSTDHIPRDLLPAYATLIAIGSSPAATYPGYALHLSSCAACGAELDALLRLVAPAYVGLTTSAPSHLQPNLAALDAPPPVVRSDHSAIDALGRLLIRFSDALLDAMRQPALAGAARGQLLYRYIQDPGSLQDLDVTIEIYSEDAAHNVGHIRVDVDAPSRGPFDQSGARVVLRAGETSWESQTDEAGCANFTRFPLNTLSQLRVEITPPGFA